jgi:catechol 2,3-dioxygenase-like lactoylglutathione lyase family enzyme
MMVSEFRFAFPARDFDRSVEFYLESLGLEALPGWWDRPDGKGALFGVSQQGTIEILGPPKGESYDGQLLAASGIHLAIRVLDVDLWYERMLAEDVPVVDPPEITPWGHYSFTCSDPDGIPITIFADAAVDA